MSADSYLKRFPHARTSTILQLQKQDRMTDKLREEVQALKQARKKRDSLINHWKQTRLWPSWIWRW